MLCDDLEGWDGERAQKAGSGSEVKASASTVGDSGWIPGSGRSPGKGNGNPLQYSCLENPMEGGAWLQSMRSQRVGHDSTLNSDSRREVTTLS